MRIGRAFISVLLFVLGVCEGFDLYDWLEDGKALSAFVAGFLWLPIVAWGGILGMVWDKE